MYVISKRNKSTFSFRTPGISLYISSCLACDLQKSVWFRLNWHWFMFWSIGNVQYSLGHCSNPCGKVCETRKKKADMLVSKQRCTDKQTPAVLYILMFVYSIFLYRPAHKPKTFRERAAKFSSLTQKIRGKNTSLEQIHDHRGRILQGEEVSEDRNSVFTWWTERGEGQMNQWMIKRMDGSSDGQNKEWINLQQRNEVWCKIFFTHPQIK